MPRPVPSSGGRKPGEHVRRQRRRRVDRHEPREQLPGRDVDPPFDPHLEGAAVVGHLDNGLKVLAAGRHGHEDVAETELGQLERVPVEAGVEPVGDKHLLRRRGGGRLVLEVDAVRQQRVRRDEVLRAEAEWRGGEALLW